MSLGLDHLIPPFMDHSIRGLELLQMESKELKSYGIHGDDKLKIKKKIKELKTIVEKEKKSKKNDNSGNNKLFNNSSNKFKRGR